MPDLDYNILVNKDNLLPENYEPHNLYVVDDNKNNFHKYTNPTLRPMLREDIRPFVEQMLNDAKKEGHDIIIDSGYRSYDYQKQVLDEYLSICGDEAYTKIAIPGASEHQTGLAFDIAYIKDGIYSDVVRKDDPEVKWMLNNAHKYGFVLRYPLGKEDVTGFSFEPWHYRYVGYGLAQVLYNEKITLEEYYQIYRGPIKKRQ